MKNAKRKNQSNEYVITMLLGILMIIGSSLIVISETTNRHLNTPSIVGVLSSGYTQPDIKPPERL
jgi:hypothetical protein